MAITTTPYGNFILNLGLGAHNLLGDAHKVALLTSSYTPNFATDLDYSQISTYELANDGASGGYKTGGIVLSNQAWNYNATTKAAALTADSVGWDALTGTTRYAVLYRSSGSSAALIGCIDFGADRTYTARPLQLAFTNNVVTLTALTL